MTISGGLRLALGSLAALALACAGAGGGAGGRGGAGEQGNTVAGGFPQPEELESLAEAPPPKAPFSLGYHDVDHWDLSGPFPDRAEAGPRDGGLAWDPLLDDLVASRAGLAVATEGMECFAREAGQFLIENAAFPGIGLQRFLAARCGLVTDQPQLMSYYWTTPSLYSVDRAVSELSDQIAERLRQHSVGGPLDVGVWMNSDGERVDLVLATGKRRVRVDPIDMVPPPDGRVVVSGEVLENTQGAAALVTQGALGWAECETDAAVALPRFRFVCPVDPDDESAWISVGLLPPGSVLIRSGLQLLVRPGGDPVRSFARHRYAEPRPAEGEEALGAAFLEVVNELRAQAGVGPLAFEAAQSETATEVAPFYFQAFADPATEPQAELVALGMMAGWQVEALVQDASFASMWLVENTDVASMVSDALAYPTTRAALLDPESARIAVGPYEDETGGVRSIALIAATYELFDEADHRALADRVHERLSVARVERKRLVPRELEEARALTVAAAMRVQGGEEPSRVLGDLIQESVDVLGRSVMGWVGEAQDLEELTFPDDFLERRQLDVAIAVSMYRPEGEAWGRYVVMMVAAEPEGRRL